MRQLILDASAASYPILGAVSAIALDGLTLVPLGAAVGVIIYIIKLAQKWQRIEDKLDLHDEMVRKMMNKLEALECMQGKRCQKRYNSDSNE